MNFNRFLDLAMRKGFAPNFTSLALKGQTRVNRPTKITAEKQKYEAVRGSAYGGRPVAQVGCPGKVPL